MKRSLFFALISSTLLFACTSQKMYYFGNYSQTLYELEKNQTEEALINYKQELEEIISESETRNLPVPPGIYAELGYIHLKENNTREAVRLFQVESRLFPESRHLMERLIQSAEARESDEPNGSDLSTSMN